MENQQQDAPSNEEWDADDRADIYGEDGAILPESLSHIGAAIGDRDILTLRQDVGALHQSEVGDLLEALIPEQRRALIDLLGNDFDFSALTEVDDAIRAQIVGTPKPATMMSTKAA